MPGQTDRSLGGNGTQGSNMEAECQHGLRDKGKKRKYLRRGEDRLPAWHCEMTWGVRPMVGALALVLGVVPILA